MQIICLTLILASYLGGANCTWTFKQPPLIYANRLIEIKTIGPFLPGALGSVAPCSKGWCKGNHGYGDFYTTYIYALLNQPSPHGENISFTTLTQTGTEGMKEDEIKTKIGSLIEVRWFFDGKYFYWNKWKTKRPLFPSLTCDSIW